MLETAKRFHDLGFAVHWLLPRSKRPIEKKWTTGPRKTFKELKSLYQKGMNIGVRLGEPSALTLPGGRIRYLAVIDCDIKSEQEKHLREMDARVRELFPGIHRTAIVASGRANGSRHYYVVSKTPVSTKRLAQSPEKVKIKMPSSDPSRFEKETLTEAELARGIRLKAAWEISIMGTGSQVVMPPSIHPDSGKRYEWTREWGTGKPFLVSSEASVKTIDSLAFDEELGDLSEEIDLEARHVPAKLMATITDGEGVEDRSSALFKVAMSLLKLGFEEKEVVSVLTNKEHYLGQAAYEHAKTRKRTRAAKWIVKYTMPKARREVDPSRDFMEEPPAKLSKKAAREQAEELSEEFASSWESKIERTDVKQGAKVKATLKNLVLILQNDVCAEVIRHNEFASTDLYGCDTPWGGEKGAEIRDIDSINIKHWFAQKWRVEPNRNLVEEAMQYVAKKNVFHPVRNYLDKLVWDGTERIDNFLKEYMSAAAAEPYLSAVSRKMLVALIARIYEPGRKFDQVVILQGNQGEGKSTALRKLVGDEWFSDATLNLVDKDTIVGMRSIWLRELGELSGMRRADVEQLKEFISRTTDRIRLPYGKRTEAFPRQCIFVGTTNKDEFLKDDTGNRRYWPVSVGKCYFDRIAKDRDQLFAEAKLAWELGEPLYLEDEEAAKGATQEQASRMESDMLLEHAQRFISDEKTKAKKDRFNLSKFLLSEAFEAGMFVTTKDDKSGQMRAASVLKKLGFTKMLARGEDGKPAKFWLLPP